MGGGEGGGLKREGGVIVGLMWGPLKVYKSYASLMELKPITYICRVLIVLNSVPNNRDSYSKPVL